MDGSGRQVNGELSFLNEILISFFLFFEDKMKNGILVIIAATPPIIMIPLSTLLDCLPPIVTNPVALLKNPPPNRINAVVF